MLKISSFKGISALILLTAVLAACSSMPRQNATLDQARNDYLAAQNSTEVTRFADSELRDAGAALDQANAAAAARDSEEKIDRLAYVAKQKIATTREVARRRAAEATVADAGRERDQLRIAQRTAEADQAKQQAAMAQNAAAAAQAQAADAQARNAQLQAMLDDMAAKKTDRGLVITLNDVLFNVDQAQLKADGIRTVQKLADFMRQYPQRTVMIEGYTDSSGSSAHNLELSSRRAAAVRTALESMGVPRERIVTRGYGEAFPVAANDTAGNRQLNRRVEIVLSDDNGKVSSR